MNLFEFPRRKRQVLNGENLSETNTTVLFYGIRIAFTIKEVIFLKKRDFQVKK